MRKTLCTLGVMLLVLFGPRPTFAIGFGDRDALLSLIELVTSAGPGADLLNFTTQIAVGVERSAIGIEDNPLTDLIGKVEDRYGSGAAAIVKKSFDKLIEVLGPNLLADVEPIHLPPGFDINNGIQEYAVVELPDGPYILDIGTTQNVGNGEFARIVLGLIDSDGDDNDAEQLLREIFTGTSGANLDFERMPGIVGVNLVSISLESFTLALQDGDFFDMLTFSGDGTKAVLAKIDAEIGIPVPEPATMLLFGCGLIGLVGLRKKFKK